MDSQNQFYYFCICLGIGFAGGILYEIFFALRLILRCNREKNRPLGIALDILFCLLFIFFSIYLSFLLHFPDFRGYMFVGYGLGMAIYLKILHRIVAFFEKVCYNTGRKLINKVKNSRRNSLKEVE